MKEKTFEELIEEKARGTSFFSKDEIKELMQQVREATIAEVKDICESAEHLDEANQYIHNLPTDRIKTEK